VRQDYLSVCVQGSYGLSESSRLQNRFIDEQQSLYGVAYYRQIVLPTGPGNPPAIQGWSAKTDWFGSRPVQKPDLLTLGGANPDLYLSTRGFRRVWRYPSVPISGSVFQVSHLWSQSELLLFIAK